MKNFLKGCATLGGLLALGGFVTMFIGLAMGGSTEYLSYNRRGWWGGSGPVTETYDVVTPVIEQETVAERPIYDYGSGHHGYSGHHGHAEAVFTEEPDEGSLLPAGSFTSLEIDLDMADVLIQPGEGYFLEVSGTGPEYKCYIEDGTLHLETASHRSLSNINLTDIDCQTFVLTLPDGCFLDEIELEIGMGSLYAEGLRCRDLNAETGMGKLTLADVVCGEKADLTAGMGELVATDFICDGKAELDVDMGSLSLYGQLGGRANIECGMGSVELTLTRPASYGYEIECGMGSVSIDGRALGSGAAARPSAEETFYEIECGMGSVEIMFE